MVETDLFMVIALVAVLVVQFVVFVSLIVALIKWLNRH